MSAAAIRGRNDSAANNSPIALFNGLDGLRPRFSSHGHSQANNGDSTTMKNEPRKVSEPAVCGTSTTSRRSEEHTSELQSLMRISYAVFCLKKKKNNRTTIHTTTNNTNRPE